MKKLIKRLFSLNHTVGEAVIVCDYMASCAYIEVQADWTGKGLNVGVVTNKGIIKKIIEDIHPSFVTETGVYSASELKIIMYNG